MAEEQSDIESRQEYKVIVNIEFRVLSDTFPSLIARDFEKYATDTICEKNKSGQSIVLKDLDVSTRELDEFEGDLDEYEMEEE